MIEAVAIDCPYCGETIEILVDASAGGQRYVEDCSVCCRPMVIGVTLDADGDPVVTAASEDDA
jgi:hypothetical protein